MSAITSLTWIPRGCAKNKPDKIRLTLDDFRETKPSSDNIANTAALCNSLSNINDHEIKLSKQKSGKQTKDDNEHDEDEYISKRYGMDEYDDEANENKNALSIENVAFLTESRDPYMIEQTESDSDDDDEILCSDSLLIVGKTHGDYNVLEVHVYTSDKTLYCHHDYILSSVPLTLEWLDFDPDDCKGNITAIGCINGDIELWDLDLMNAVEPSLTLFGVQAKKNHKNKRRKTVNGHVDAVLSLAWNKLQRNVLTSASADHSIIIWDLSEAKMVSKIEKHSDKVQSIAWHSDESQTLLSGSADKCAVVYDCRNPSALCKIWSVKSEIEQVMWHDKKPYMFYAGTNTGRLYAFDIRAEKPVSRIKAHDDAITGLSMGVTTDNMYTLYSASVDKTIKLWNVTEESPALLSKRNAKIGRVFCAVSNPDEPSIVAIGGEREFRIQNFVL